jgi:hypothetical protein
LIGSAPPWLYVVVAIVLPLIIIGTVAAIDLKRYLKARTNERTLNKALRSYIDSSARAADADASSSDAKRDGTEP